MAISTQMHASTSADGQGANNQAELVISRNKHWRYITCYHGNWLQLPVEVLQSMAHENWTMARPQLIHPAVFFDMAKIRRAVEEATDEARRANDGTTNPAGTSQQNQYDLYGTSGPPPGKMSKERIHRVRQKAVKLLASAYSNDEIATCVIAMQSPSLLNEVAEHVLKRDKQDLDAKYVHFFHEKVPARFMENHTSLDPLSDMIANSTIDARAAPLRTRGITQIFKRELENSVIDFSLAIQIAHSNQQRHQKSNDQLVLAKDYRTEREKWLNDPKSRPRLKEEEQPSSMLPQLLFQRGCVYLELASLSVKAALDGHRELSITKDADHVSTERSPEEVEKLQKLVVLRKKVKVNAKRASQDFLAFLAQLDYTPVYPMEMTGKKVHPNGAQAGSVTRAAPFGHHPDNTEQSKTQVTKMSSESGAMVHTPPKSQHRNAHPIDWSKYTPRLYALSDLFAEKPIPDLPSITAPLSDSIERGTCEALTYHPLLIDVLHSLLLCHCLMQTSPTEIKRHAHSAARLARVADGYPLFQIPRSAARSEWMEVLRRCDNWIKLDRPWTQLSSRYTSSQADWRNGEGINVEHLRRKEAAKSLLNGASTSEQEKARRDKRLQDQAMYDALGDDRAVDSETFKRCVAEKMEKVRRDEEKDRAIFGNDSSSHAHTDGESKESKQDKGKAFAQDGLDDDMEFPVAHSRAALIARWVREAPVSIPGVPGAGGGKKKRRRPKRTGQGVVGGMEKLDVRDQDEGDEVD